MTARTRAGLGWGVVAALAFLVLLQSHVLAGGEPATIPVALGSALAVGVAATVLTILLARRLDADP